METYLRQTTKPGVLSVKSGAGEFLLAVSDLVTNQNFYLVEIKQPLWWQYLSH